MSKETPPPVERIAREAGLDDTIEQTFPASDPPSSIPNPCQYELLDDADLPKEGKPTAGRGTPDS
jgi:hypothetical protein